MYVTAMSMYGQRKKNLINLYCNPSEHFAVYVIPRSLTRVNVLPVANTWRHGSRTGEASLTIKSIGYSGCKTVASVVWAAKDVGSSSFLQNSCHRSARALKSIDIAQDGMFVSGIPYVLAPMIYQDCDPVAEEHFSINRWVGSGK